jgi:hypothetical protein
MTDPVPNKIDPAEAKAKLPEGKGQEEERMEDEEKILSGRHDVNYPALLTKDVPGG